MKESHILEHHHEHGEEEEHEHEHEDEESANDPHIWLDQLLIKKRLNLLKINSYKRIDHKEYYQKIIKISLKI